ncbi:MAG: ATP-binding protein, partial [Vulcanimicrobiaceae bacterium]
LDERPRELVVASRAGDADDVVVEVRDAGPGIATAQADHLFSSFYSTKPEGMGMGLSISRLIVETHGGQLVVLPNVPHGAVFRFTLPLHPEHDDD